MKKIKVCMCDDLVPLCHYFENSFEEVENIEFAGMAHNSEDCLEMIKEHNPDVLLLDVQIEAFDSGIKLIPGIKEISPDIRIIILTIHKESELIFNAFTLGACAYHLKSDPFENIVNTIINSCDNTVAIQPEIADIFMNECRKINSQNSSLLYMVSMISKLTPSEMQILIDIGNGLSNKDIASKRFVEEPTVRSQISRLLKKFNLSSSYELRSIIKKLHLVQFFNDKNNQ